VFHPFSLWIYTMKRWTFLPLALAGLLAAGAAVAQGFVREAPRDVRPGIIVVSATPPVITVDGKPDRLSPGARIRDHNNLLVLSGGLATKTVHSVYRRDPSGLVHEVWMLTPEEYAKVAPAYAAPQDGPKKFAELLSVVFGNRK
jgi:hypothetical protein